jgi:hypothetical protein
MDQQYTTTGAAALYILMKWMGERRRSVLEPRMIAMRGGVGLLGAIAYHAYGGELWEAQEFWNTARYLLATYGAYEAFQLVRFNLDAYKWGIGEDFFEALIPTPSMRLRANSRLALQDNYFEEKSVEFPVMNISHEHLPVLMTVMTAAVLMERLQLRRHLSKFPFEAVGLLALAKELPVTRNRR